MKFLKATATCLLIIMISSAIFPAIAYAYTLQITLTIGSKTATVNGKKVELDVPPQVIKGRTMVPLRFIGEQLGATLRYDPDTGEIDIWREDHDSVTATIQLMDFSINNCQDTGYDTRVEINRKYFKISIGYFFKDKESSSLTCAIIGNNGAIKEEEINPAKQNLDLNGVKIIILENIGTNKYSISLFAKNVEILDVKAFQSDFKDFPEF